MKLKQNFHGGYRQLNVFDYLMSQKVRSFRTFSKLLKALQYETELIRHVAYTYLNYFCQKKFEVNFESLFEHLLTT